MLMRHGLLLLGFVAALVTAQTKLVWVHTTANCVASTVVAANGAVFTGTDGDHLISLNQATGSLLWSFQADQWIQNNPIVWNGIVYFGTVGGTVYAVNASTGSSIWSSGSHGEFNNERPATGVINNVNVIYLGSGSGVMNAFNALTGAVIWSYTSSQSIYSSPVLENGIIYFGNYGGQVTAVNAITGAQVWVDQVSGSAEVFEGCFLNGVVYFGSMSSNLITAINATTGVNIWQQPTSSGVIGAPAASASLGLVFINQNNGQVTAVSVQSGTTKWTATVGGSQSNSDIVLVDGTVVVGAYQGIYGFNAATGEGVWNYTVSGSNSYASQLGEVTISNGVAYFGMCLGTASGVYAVSVPVASGINEMQCEDEACKTACRQITVPTGCVTSPLPPFSTSRSVHGTEMKVTEFFDSSSCDHTTPFVSKGYEAKRCYAVPSGGSFYWTV